MNAFKTLILSIVIVGLFLQIGCKKRNDNFDSDGLPKASQTGRMTFAGKVNGQNWIVPKSIDVVAGYVDDNLTLRGTIASKGEQFEIQVNNVGSKRKVRLNDAYQEGVAILNTSNACLNSTAGGRFRSADGELLITSFDKNKKIVSGTFWFAIPTPNCGEVKFTSGRFDIFYLAYDIRLN